MEEPADRDANARKSRSELEMVDMNMPLGGESVNHILPKAHKMKREPAPFLTSFYRGRQCRLAKME